MASKALGWLADALGWLAVPQAELARLAAEPTSSAEFFAKIGRCVVTSNPYLLLRTTMGGTGYNTGLVIGSLKTKIDASDGGAAALPPPLDRSALRGLGRIVTLCHRSSTSCQIR